MVREKWRERGLDNEGMLQSGTNGGEFKEHSEMSERIQEEHQ